MSRAGIELKAHGFEEKASEMFEQTLNWLRQRDPKDLQSDSLKYQYAWALITTQNLKEAETVLRDLHEAKPENLSYLGSLGLVTARKGDKEEALRISEQIKNWNKPYVFGNDLFWQGAIAASLGEKEQAVALLREALSQGQEYDNLYCNIILEPLWDYPAFIELIKPKD
jgi:tetratricopeptide (TPR) repeat protein